MKSCCRHTLEAVLKQARTMLEAAPETDCRKRIKKLMIDEDVTVVDLATIAGCSRQNVSQVICGKHGSSWVRKIIATALGVQVTDLWPETDAAKGAARP